MARFTCSAPFRARLLFCFSQGARRLHYRPTPVKTKRHKRSLDRRWPIVFGTLAPERKAKKQWVLVDYVSDGNGCVPQPLCVNSVGAMQTWACGVWRVRDNDTHPHVIKQPLAGYGRRDGCPVCPPTICGRGTETGVTCTGGAA